MSTPPVQPGQAATLERPQLAGAGAGGPAAGGRPSQQPVRFGVHQVLWGIGGVILGLTIGVVGTQAESSSAHPAAAAAPRVSTPATGAAATGRTGLRGTAMYGEGMFIIGRDIRSGVWHTAGAIGGKTGRCYVALLGDTRTWSVIGSHSGTGPVSVTTTARTKAIRTSGCQNWHRVSGQPQARSRPGPPRLRPLLPGGRRDGI